MNSYSRQRAFARLLATGLVQLCIIVPMFSQLTFPDFYNNYLTTKEKRGDFFKNIPGSPYVNPDFTPATAYLLGEKAPIKSEMRYNNCLDEMEFLKDGEDLFLVLDNKSEVDSIVLNGEVYRYLSFKDKASYSSGYFISVFNGPCKLFFRQFIEFLPEKKPTTAYDKYLPPRFAETKESFYVQFSDDPLLLIPRSNRQIRKLFAAHGIESSYTGRVSYNAESLTDFFSGIAP